MPPGVSEDSGDCQLLGSRCTCWSLFCVTELAHLPEACRYDKLASWWGSRTSWEPTGEERKEMHRLCLSLLSNER